MIQIAFFFCEFFELGFDPWLRGAARVQHGSIYFPRRHGLGSSHLVPVVVPEAGCSAGMDFFVGGFGHRARCISVSSSFSFCQMSPCL